jgi:cobalt-precorrin 5A hydrolase
MARDKAVNVRYGIGVGARKTFAARELADLVLEVAARFEADLGEATLAALATHEGGDEFSRVAEMLGMNFELLPLERVQQAKQHVLTRSPRIEAMFGVGSLSEGLALASAGAGARLLAPRIATTRLTCAIAKGEDA